MKWVSTNKTKLNTPAANTLMMVVKWYQLSQVWCKGWLKSYKLWLRNCLDGSKLDEKWSRPGTMCSRVELTVNGSRSWTYLRVDSTDNDSYCQHHRYIPRGQIFNSNKAPSGHFRNPLGGKFGMNISRSISISISFIHSNHYKWYIGQIVTKCASWRWNFELGRHWSWKVVQVRNP